MQAGIRIKSKDINIIYSIFLYSNKMKFWQSYISIQIFRSIKKIMSLDFILIPSCIVIILFLLNRENIIYKKNQKAK